MLLVLAGCQPDILTPPPEEEETPVAFSVTSVAPTSGPGSGGTTVSVKGTGFSDAATIAVGGAACASVSWIASTELVCVTPAGAAGESTLTVRDGANEASVAWTYLGADTGGGDTDTGGRDTGRDTGGRDTGRDTGGRDTGGDTGGRDTGHGETGITPVPIDYCHLQYPCSMTAAAGGTSESVYGWVYQAGVTEGAGAGSGLTLQVGVGPDGSDPATDGGWVWAAMTYNVDKDGLSSGDLANDEYMGTFTAPSSAGAYDYCVRASADGGASWTYCDGGGASCPGSGSDDGYAAADAGALVVL